MSTPDSAKKAPFEDTEFSKILLKILRMIAMYGKTLVLVSFAPRFLSVGADVLPPATFLATSASIVYLVYRIIFPSDPVQSYELPTRLTPIFSAISRLPLTVPIVALSYVLILMIGPYLMFKVGSKIRFGQALNIYAYFCAGPLTITLLLLATAVVLPLTGQIAFDTFRVTLLPLLVIAQFVWLTVAFAVATGRRKGACVVLLFVGAALGNLINPMDPGKFVSVNEMIGLGMAPALFPGEHVLTNTYVFRFRRPRRGEIIAYRTNDPSDSIYVDRVIGLPGETVKIVDKKLYIEGAALPEPYAKHNDSTIYRGTDQALPETLIRRDNYGPIVIPDDAYLVLGDDRDDSNDSRYLGPIQHSDILGKVYYRFWPLVLAGPTQ